MTVSPSRTPEARRAYRQANPDKVRSWGNREKKAEWSRAYMKARKDELMAEMIEAYGGGCTCCGLTDPAFLTIEHVGGLQGKKRVSPMSELIRLKKEGWPDRCTVYCFNCNLGSWRNGGTCPHQIVQDRSI